VYGAELTHRTTPAVSPSQQRRHDQRSSYQEGSGSRRRSYDSPRLHDTSSLPHSYRKEYTPTGPPLMTMSTYGQVKSSPSSSSRNPYGPLDGLLESMSRGSYSKDTRSPYSGPAQNGLSSAGPPQRDLTNGYSPSYSPQRDPYSSRGHHRQEPATENRYPRYRAKFRYQPQNEDELELQEGDTVFVMEKCDDGWFVGTSERTKEFGTFPGNYVQSL